MKTLKQEIIAGIESGAIISIFIILAFLPMIIIYFLTDSGYAALSTTMALMGLFFLFVLTKILPHYSKQEIGLKKVEFKRLIYFIVIGLLVGVVSIKLQLFLSQTTERISDVFYGFLYIVIVAPIVEEILMRGFIFRWIELKTKSGFWALLLSSLIFAALHIENISIGLMPLTERFFAKFIAGLLYGGLFYRFRNLLPGTIAHSTNNLVGFIMPFFAMPL